MSRVERLDWIATRMLMEDRVATIGANPKKSDAVATGILSPDQYRRRLANEVYDPPKSTPMIRKTAAITGSGKNFRRREMGITGLQRLRADAS